MIAASLRRCVLCGRRRSPRGHHTGGQNHIAWLKNILCEPCHENFHARFRQSVDYRFTPDNKIRLIRAMQSVLVFLWVLLEMLMKELQSEAG
jgi:hypothetical protein